MIVDITQEATATTVKFKAKDFTNFNDLLNITSAIASSYCFEAGCLTSDSFKLFLDRMKPRTSYSVVIGYDDEEVSFVSWGESKLFV